MKRFAGLLWAIGAAACAPRYFLPPATPAPAVRHAPAPGVPLAVIEARAFARVRASFRVAGQDNVARRLVVLSD